MLRTLLAKDLRRAWHNPVPWLINLALPLCITALIGLAFSGKSDSGPLGRIRFAVVDEDKTPLSDFLRGAANQREGGKYLAPVFVDRAEALRQINGNKISAVLIIPSHFTRNYLTGREPVKLELIKNPAESVHPAVLEELLGALTTALNALARNFQADLSEWEPVIEGKADYHRVSALVEREGAKLQAVKRYIDPPLVSYAKVAPAGEPGTIGARPGPAFNLFGFLLAGMAGMFLLFLANNGMTDLHRELRLRTFERYHTLHQSLLPFLAGKVLFTVVLLLFGSAVMLGGGALVFRIPWPQPLGLAAVTFSYACFAACLMTLCVAVVADERRANVLNNITGMVLGLAGGCAFPAQQLPAFLREHVTPWLPTCWFTRALQTNTGWLSAAVQLLAVSAGLIALAAFVFRRRFKTGVR